MEPLCVPMDALCVPVECLCVFIEYLWLPVDSLSVPMDGLCDPMDSLRLHEHSLCCQGWSLSPYEVSVWPHGLSLCVPVECLCLHAAPVHPQRRARPSAAPPLP